jgi:hypothetical protein
MNIFALTLSHLIWSREQGWLTIDEAFWYQYLLHLLCTTPTNDACHINRCLDNRAMASAFGTGSADGTSFGINANETFAVKVALLARIFTSLLPVCHSVLPFYLVDSAGDLINSN